MYPYNTSNERAKKSIVAARKDFPEPLANNTSLSELFSNAIADETMDSAKYKALMDYLTKNGLDDLAQLAKTMYSDESSHKMLLEAMADDDGIEYTEPSDMTEEFDFSLEGLLNNVSSEIEGARFYRDFMRVLNNENAGDTEVISDIMNDEQNHAVLNSLIYSTLLSNTK